jgi:hypothetical protein
VAELDRRGTSIDVESNRATEAASGHVTVPQSPNGVARSLSNALAVQRRRVAPSVASAGWAAAQ